ncbi:MAG: hypothetical protein WBP82_08280, partial [Leuconostoc mesenteroides]
LFNITKILSFEFYVIFQLLLCRNQKQQKRGKNQRTVKTLNLSPRIFYINRCLLNISKDGALGH